MSAVPVDLAISCRWILPMTSPAEVLEHHTLVIRDGRILDLLPTVLVSGRYAATTHIDRSRHLALPGLVNTCTQIAPPPGRAIAPERLHDGAQLCMAEMLAAGTTCFCALGGFPEETARAAAEQGMRAVIGIPIAETASRWAASPGEYLTRALSFRDEYRGHPTITTAFAPSAPNAISDATFARIATLAAELDAAIVAPLHASRVDVDECVIRHGARPIARLHALGLLTPALTALQMAAVNAADVQLAQRNGIAVALCPESGLRTGGALPPVSTWAAAGLRLSLGSGIGIPGASVDLWTAMRSLVSLSMTADPGLADLPHRALQAGDALAAATRGGAAALGLDAEIGTLEKGKWADLCCIDLHGPAAPWATLGAPVDSVATLVFNGGRDLVSDVWVSGRQLVNARAFTRLDWPHASERVAARHLSPATGE